MARLELPPDEALDAAALARLARRPPIHLYRLIALAPGLLAPVLDLVQANFDTLCVPAVLREAAILRVACHHGSGYELHHHALIARGCGLTARAIAALAAGDRHSPEWPPGLQDVVDFVDGLLLERDPGPAFDRIHAVHGARAVVELALLAGFYRMVATFIDAMDLEPEDGDPVGAWHRTTKA